MTETEMAIDKKVYKNIKIFLENEQELPEKKKQTFPLLKFLLLAKADRRRELEKAILEGQVTVNGIPVYDVRHPVFLSDVILYRGKKVFLEKGVYIVINKPKGYSPLKKPGKSHPSVFELLPEEVRKLPLQAAGDMDIEARGLLLLSSDTLFLQHIKNPKYKVLKRVRITLDETLLPYEMNLLTGRGVYAGKRKLKLLSLQLIGVDRPVYEAVLFKGADILKQAMEELLYQVHDIYFVSIGELHLEKLKLEEGKYMEIDPSLVWEWKPETAYLIQLYKELTG